MLDKKYSTPKTVVKGFLDDMFVDMNKTALDIARRSKMKKP